ncbi:MAG: hypothetical protein U5M23_04965 [Marinagarivorans sp.]|nr:hypothetical protein [Marinagarivorans sp.]
MERLPGELDEEPVLKLNEELAAKLNEELAVKLNEELDLKLNDEPLDKELVLDDELDEVGSPPHADNSPAAIMAMIFNFIIYFTIKMR